MNQSDSARDPWLLQPDWPARLTLIFLVACLYAGVVLINNELLFFWAADTSYRYWFYPPAGIRLVLIMLLGWPGVAGYFVAALALLSSNLVPEIAQYEHALYLAAGRAISIWVALVGYGWITGVKRPWRNLTWQHVPFLALFVSAVSATVAYLLKWGIGLESLNDLIRNVSLNVLGDTLGTIVVLVIAIRLRRAYRDYQRQQGNNVPAEVV